MYQQIKDLTVAERGLQSGKTTTPGGRRRVLQKQFTVLQIVRYVEYEVSDPRLTDRQNLACMI